MAVLWHYTGRFYVGRWKKGYCDCEGFKCGLGMEYYPKGKYLCIQGLFTMELSIRMFGRGMDS